MSIVRKLFICSKTVFLIEDKGDFCELELSCKKINTLGVKLELKRFEEKKADSFWLMSRICQPFEKFRDRKVMKKKAKDVIVK